MKILFFLVAVSLLNDSFGSSLDCKKICRDYTKREDFMSPRTCNPSLFLQPRDVHKACVKGRLLAFEQACLPTCSNQDWKGKTETGDSFQACKEFANKPSPNNHLAWCRKGFDDYYKKISKDIKLQVEQILEEERKSLQTDENASELRSLSEDDSFKNDTLKVNESPESIQTIIEIETIQDNLLPNIHSDLTQVQEEVELSEITSEVKNDELSKTHSHEIDFIHDIDPWNDASEDETVNEDLNKVHTMLKYDNEEVSIGVFEHEESEHSNDQYEYLLTTFDEDF